MSTLGWRFYAVALPSCGLAALIYTKLPASNTRDIVGAVIATAGCIAGALWSTQTRINRGDLP